MIFYHGTSKENWKAIQEEGILWGRRFIKDDYGNIITEIDRCTYLATDKEEAEKYGNVVLEVEYDPLLSCNNNYDPVCWQFRVYEPIEIKNIKVV